MFSCFKTLQCLTRLILFLHSGYSWAVCPTLSQSFFFFFFFFFFLISKGQHRFLLKRHSLILPQFLESPLTSAANNKAWSSFCARLTWPRTERHEEKAFPRRQPACIYCDSDGAILFPHGASVPSFGLRKASRTSHTAIQSTPSRVQTAISLQVASKPQSQ